MGLDITHQALATKEVIEQVNKLIIMSLKLSVNY